MKPLAVLRPEPGNARTAARIEVSGLRAICLPLFTVEPVAWTPPDLSRFDALLATSANAFRHGGAGLATLRALPVFAVGEATAAAARDAGFTIARIGDADAAALLAEAPGTRLLHLAGRERIALSVEAIETYRALPVPLDPIDAASLAGAVALLHSARAARRLAEVADAHGVARASIVVAALSAQVAAAAGPGWAQVAVAERPRDAALVGLAAMLARRPATSPIDRARRDGDRCPS